MKKTTTLFLNIFFRLIICSLYLKGMSQLTNVMNTSYTPYAWEISLLSMIFLTFFVSFLAVRDLSRYFTKKEVKTNV